MENKIQIPAVHDKDLRQILDKFGVSAKIDSGELFCVNCGEIITWENIFAFKIIDDDLLIFCDRIDCIENSSK